MDLSRLEKEYSKVKNLRQYRNYTEEQLKKVALIRVMEHIADVQSLFELPEEKELSSQLVSKYLNDFTPENVSDINILRSIVFLEIITDRLQKILNTQYKNNEVDLDTVDTMHKNLSKTLELKKSLGILDENKSSGDGEKAIASLKKQATLWREENQGSRQIVCPYCHQMVLLKIRTGIWETQKHPFFKDRILYNKYLVELYLKGILTRDDIGKVLETSPDYTNWLIDKLWKTNKHYKEYMASLEKKEVKIEQTEAKTEETGEIDGKQD